MNAIIRSSLSDYPPLIPFELTVPTLAVLTGENGAGKSRLLKSIKDGKISYTGKDGTTLNPDDIRYVETVGYSFQGNPPQERNIISLCKLHQINYKKLHNAIDALRRHVLGSKAEDHRTDLEEFELDKRIVDLIKGELSERSVLLQPGDLTNVINAIDNCVLSLRRKGAEIDEQDILSLTIRSFFPKVEKGLGVTVADPLSFQLIELFELWRQRYAHNLYEAFLKTQNDPIASPLSDDEFIDQHGPKPWEVLNGILTKSGTELQFKVDESQLNRRERPFQELHLVDSKGNSFPATGISSGERVIFQVAMSRYIAEAENINYKKPKLILFDEPDAHLHPSLANQLLNILKQQFVKQGINIIVSTHSPTTVGLSDEGSIVFMRSYEQPKISSRRLATNALLSGQEKLFIDLSGTKIVFVEDGTDVERFEALCSALNLPGSNHVMFRSISKRVPEGNIDGGKDRVRQLLKSLGSEKNIVGLIDFDNKERSGSGVHILCEDERYGIENLLLDPRILVCFLLREDTPKFAKMFDLKITTFNEFDQIPVSEMQQCINRVQFDVLGEEFGDLQMVKYEDGSEFVICTGWLLKKCHDLETEVESQYRLKAKCQGVDPLIRICTQTIPEKPGLMPLSFRNSIEKLFE